MSGGTTRLVTKAKRDRRARQRPLSLHSTPSSEEKKNAKDYLSKTQTAVSTGTFVEPSPLMVGEYLDRWLETAARPRLCERTLADYKEKLDRYVRPLIGGKRLCDVRPLDIRALCTHMISAKLDKGAPPQVGVIYGLGLAEEDACGIIFTFALVTGMRPEEYLGLKWSDVDLEKGAATVRRTTRLAQGRRVVLRRVENLAVEAHRPVAVFSSSARFGRTGERKLRIA